MLLDRIVCSPPFQTCSYVLADGNEAVVVDPGRGSAGNLLEAAKKENAEIILIINTHGHGDHVADDRLLREKTRAPVAVHEADSLLLENPSSFNFGFGFLVPAVKPTKFLEEGDNLRVGALQLTVLHTPGHTPGSVCLYCKGQNLLFTGDTLFEGTHGRTDLQGSSPAEMRKSLRRLAGLPKQTRVLPGHGSETTIAAEAWLEKA